MKESDFDSFGMMMTTTSELYGKKVSPQMLMMYFTALMNYAIDDVRVGLNLHIRNPDNGQFMPKPADIIRMIEGNTQNQGARAWTKVLDAIERVGVYRSVAFDDQIIHRVIGDMGGWIKMCGITVEDTPFVARDFEKRYQAYSASRMTLGNDYAPILVGLSDAMNQKEGFAAQPAVLIGDSAKAAATIAAGKSVAGTLITRTENQPARIEHVASEVQRRSVQQPSPSHRVTEAEALAAPTGTPAINWSNEGGEAF